MKFAVVASFSGFEVDGWTDEYTLQDAVNACETAFCEDVELTEPGDSEYSYLADESEPGSDWEKLQDFQISGILTKDEFLSLLNSLGGYVNDCETMGTLGGPLSDGMPYIVPDLDVTIESRLLIACMRVTPFPDVCRESSEISEEIREERWEWLKDAMRATYGRNRNNW